MRVATLGAALSGNKGAASMIEALSTHFDGAATIVLLTTYPAEDRALAADNVVVVALGPIPLVSRDLPLALLSRVMPRRWRRVVLERSPALTALASCDVVADISGVSFVDHRGWKFHLYNSLLTALPVLVGTPTVKCAQALGPFENRLNRTLARLLLPRVDRILARGQRSYDHVAELGIPLRRLDRAADLAFTLSHDAPLLDAVSVRLAPLADRGVVVFMPSAVVEGWCERHDIDHTALMATVIRRLCDELGVGVALVPHACRPSGKPRRMDDARVCRSIAAALGARDDVVLVDEDLEPSQLRSVVDHCDLLVASRFHGMVTGLACATPTVVLGWGHKYAEVLAEFGAESFAMDFSALRSPDTVAAAIIDAWNNRAAIEAQLADALPAVVESANSNFASLTAVASSR